jgi:hypothetical protein
VKADPEVKVEGKRVVLVSSRPFIGPNEQRLVSRPFVEGSATVILEGGGNATGLLLRFGFGSQGEWAIIVFDRHARTFRLIDVTLAP